MPTPTGGSNGGNNTFPSILFPPRVTSLTTTSSLLRRPIPPEFQGLRLLRSNSGDTLPWGHSANIDQFLLREAGWTDAQISQYQRRPEVRAQYSVRFGSLAITESIARDRIRDVRLQARTNPGVLSQLPGVSTVFPDARRRLNYNILRTEVSDTLAFSRQLYTSRLTRLNTRISEDIEAGRYRPEVYQGWIREFREALRTDARSLCVEYAPQSVRPRFLRDSPEETLRRSWSMSGGRRFDHLPIPREFIGNSPGDFGFNLYEMGYARRFYERYPLNSPRERRRGLTPWILEYNRPGTLQVYDHVHVTLTGFNRELERISRAVAESNNGQGLQSALRANSLFIGDFRLARLSGRGRIRVEDLLRSDTPILSDTPVTVARVNGIQIKMAANGQLSYELPAHANRTQGTNGGGQREVLPQTGTITTQTPQRMTPCALEGMMSQALRHQTLSFSQAQTAVRRLIRHKSALKNEIMMTMNLRERQELEQQLAQAERFHQQIFERYRTTNPAPAANNFQSQYRALVLAPNAQKTTYLRNILNIPQIRRASTNQGPFWNNVRFVMQAAFQDCNPGLIADRRYMNEALGQIAPWVNRAEGQVRMQGIMGQLNQIEGAADGEDE